MKVKNQTALYGSTGGAIPPELRESSKERSSRKRNLREKALERRSVRKRNMTQRRRLREWCQLQDLQNLCSTWRKATLDPRGWKLEIIQGGSQVEPVVRRRER